MKAEIEELESLLDKTTRRWIWEESWKKQGAKKAARYLTPSAQMARVQS